MIEKPQLVWGKIWEGDRESRYMIIAGSRGVSLEQLQNFHPDEVLIGRPFLKKNNVDSFTLTKQVDGKFLWSHYYFLQGGQWYKWKSLENREFLCELHVVNLTRDEIGEIRYGFEALIANGGYYGITPILSAYTELDHFRFSEVEQEKKKILIVNALQVLLSADDIGAIVRYLLDIYLSGTRSVVIVDHNYDLQKKLQIIEHVMCLLPVDRLDNFTFCTNAYLKADLQNFRICFLESDVPLSIADGFDLVRPSSFISEPKRFVKLLIDALDWVDANDLADDILLTTHASNFQNQEGELSRKINNRKWHRRMGSKNVTDLEIIEHLNNSPEDILTNEPDLKRILMQREPNQKLTDALIRLILDHNQAIHHLSEERYSFLFSLSIQDAKKILSHYEFSDQHLDSLVSWIYRQFVQSNNVASLPSFLDEYFSEDRVPDKFKENLFINIYQSTGEDNLLRRILDLTNSPDTFQRVAKAMPKTVSKLGEIFISYVNKKSFDWKKVTERNDDDYSRLVKLLALTIENPESSEFASAGFVIFLTQNFWLQHKDWKLEFLGWLKTGKDIKYFPGAIALFFLFPDHLKDLDSVFFVSQPSIAKIKPDVEKTVSQLEIRDSEKFAQICLYFSQKYPNIFKDPNYWINLLGTNNDEAKRYILKTWLDDLYNNFDRDQDAIQLLTSWARIYSIDMFDLAAKSFFSKAVHNYVLKNQIGKLAELVKLPILQKKDFCKYTAEIISQELINKNASELIYREIYEQVPNILRFDFILGISPEIAINLDMGAFIGANKRFSGMVPTDILLNLIRKKKIEPIAFAQLFIRLYFPQDFLITNPSLKELVINMPSEFFIRVIYAFKALGNISMVKNVLKMRVNNDFWFLAYILDDIRKNFDEINYSDVGILSKDPLKDFKRHYMEIKKQINNFINQSKK